jgi:hypothetical protein
MPESGKRKKQEKLTNIWFKEMKTNEMPDDMQDSL